jgi:3-hydroxyisobutyrate dehydrogenase-like beta-hydroxyacid dehydrogenase
MPEGNGAASFSVDGRRKDLGLTLPPPSSRPATALLDGVRSIFGAAAGRGHAENDSAAAYTASGDLSRV